MADTADKVVKIKVIGVGGAGNNVINRMIASDVKGVEFVAVNTDKQDLEKSKCKNKVQIGEKLTGGMGAGSKPDIGQKSAEESKALISQVLEGTDMVFITAGMGGGTGTGAAPIIAQVAHDAGILTVAVVTKPFRFEGANRMKQAEAGIANLTDKVDSMIIIPNDRLKFVTDQKITFANAFGIAPTQFTFAFAAAPKLLLLRVAALAAVCSLMSILFCVTMHGTERLFSSRIPNTWLRIAAGGGIVIVLSLLVGTGDYNGAGMDVITRAIEGGQAAPDAFFWKLLFTAVTIGCGFKGGEVVPSFFVGAAFGCVLGGLLGLPPAFAAAIGLVSVFCGAVNCPIASVILSIELFGSGGLVYFAAACALSYLLSGYCGLYSSQTILYSKLKAEFINVHTHE